MTSMPGHVYLRNGLNDTITFNLDPEETSFVNFQVEYLDKHAQVDKLNLKGNRKKKYLTPNLNQWNGKAQLSSFTEGVRPTYEKTQYDS